MDSKIKAIISKIKASQQNHVIVVKGLDPLSILFPRWSDVKKVEESLYLYEGHHYVGFVHKEEIEPKDRKITNGVVVTRDCNGNLVGEKFYPFLTTELVAEILKEEA